MPFTVFETKLGSPEDVKEICNMKIEEHKTLMDLKMMLLATDLVKDLK